MVMVKVMVIVIFMIIITVNLIVIIKVTVNAKVLFSNALLGNIFYGYVYSFGYGYVR